MTPPRQPQGCCGFAERFSRDSRYLWSDGCEADSARKVISHVCFFRRCVNNRCGLRGEEAGEKLPSVGPSDLFLEDVLFAFLRPGDLGADRTIPLHQACAVGFMAGGENSQTGKFRRRQTRTQSPEQVHSQTQRAAHVPD